MVADKKTALVVSAHSADFVWRAGGAIALYAERGWEITAVCLSFGERGESAKLWRQPGMTMDAVKANRKQEANRAAELEAATQAGGQRPQDPEADRRAHPRAHEAK